VSTLALIFLAVWRGAGVAQQSRPSWLFTALLMGATAALIMTGYRGGQNVYRYGIGVQSVGAVLSAPRATTKTPCGPVGAARHSHRLA